MEYARQRFWQYWNENSLGWKFVLGRSKNCIIVYFDEKCSSFAFMSRYVVVSFEISSVNMFCKGNLQVGWFLLETGADQISILKAQLMFWEDLRAHHFMAKCKCSCLSKKKMMEKKTVMYLLVRKINIFHRLSSLGEKAIDFLWGGRDLTSGDITISCCMTTYCAMSP